MISKKIRCVAYENDNSALVPELWAQESLAILEENMVLGNLVFRDFENSFAMFGKVVHTRKPAAFTAVRKTDDENVTIQDAKSTNINVHLNQHWHTSFLIKDGEETKSFKDLVNFYLSPAVLSIAQAIDRVICAQTPRFIWSNSFGQLGTQPSNTDGMLEVRNVMNKNKAYASGRNFIFTPDTETNLLKLTEFTEAQKVGDMGVALREAMLGRKLGFDCYMAQNQPSVSRASGTATSTIADTLGAAAKKGDTSITLTTGTGCVAGMMIAVDGDPQYVTSYTASTKTAVVYPGLREDVANGKAAVMYKYAVTASAYDAGESGEITIATMTDFVVGQSFVAHPTAAASATPGDLPIYTMVAVNAANKIVLDRPLDSGLASGAFLSPLPVGNYNLAFHRNALALVTRPLKPPRPGTGAMSATAMFNGLGIRVTITYSGEKQGHLVTVDILGGVAVLEPKLAAVLLA